MYGTARCRATLSGEALTLPRNLRAGISALVLVAASTILPVPTAAQSYADRAPEFAAMPSDHIVLLSLNALIGGLSAGLVRLARSDPVDEAFTDGFLRGAVGGAVSYAGKRVATERFDGAGFLGRQIAAIGASTTANAADDIAPFDRLLLPLGPLPARLLIANSESGLSIRPLIDLISAAGVVYGLAASRYSIDWRSSFSGGVTIFREADPLLDGSGVLGVGIASYGASSDRQEENSASLISGAIAVGGTIFTRYRNNLDDTVFAHERVHVLQFDFLSATLGDRMDTWVLTNLPSVDRVLKINLIPVALGTINQTVLSFSNHDNYPWEWEASMLSGRR